MKIGFFVNTYLPNIFGSTNSVEYFRKGLESLGDEVTVFAPRWHGYLDVNKKVVRYPSIQWKYKIEYPLAISYYPPYANMAEKKRLDLIHIHQPFLMGREGIRQARRNNIPCIFTYHCKYEEYTHYAPLIPQAILKWYVKKQAINVVNKCDYVVAPSEDIKNILVKRGAKTPIKVLPTGIDWEKYQKGNRQRIRNAYHIKDDQICLLWVGRIEQEKNIDLMKKVVARLMEENRKINLLVVGDGSQKRRLIDYFEQAGLQGRVCFTGLVPQEEIEDYYAAGDILVNFSLSETQGLVINEAMATGLAIASVTSTGVNDLVKNGESGILMEDSEDACVKAIRQLMDNPKQIKFLGSNAKKEAKRYDYHQKAKELKALYEQALSDFQK